MDTRRYVTIVRQEYSLTKTGGGGIYGHGIVVNFRVGANRACKALLRS